MAGTSRCVRTAVLAVLVTAVGCRSTARDQVRSTTGDWDRDVSSADARLNAARILDTPEETVNPPFTLQVGSASTVVHSQPDVYSAPVARLPFGTAVQVEARARFLRVPDQARMHESAPQGDESAPTWMRIRTEGASGWVSARSLARPLYVAHASEVKPGGATVLAASSAGAAAADAILAVAMRPARFDFTSATAFAPAGRLDSLRTAGAPLDRIDAELAKEMADERAAYCGPPGPWEPAEAEKSIAGGIRRIIRATDEGTLNEAVPDVVGEFTRDEPITPVEERWLARECLAALVGGSGTLPPEDPIACYVNSIGNRVAAQGSLPYPAAGTLFVVLDSDAIDAVAVPGGPVLVTVGMLRFLENEHELACVLAHEVAHVEERHVVDSLLSRGSGKKLNAAVRLRASIDAGKLDDALRTAFSSLPEPLRQTAFDRARPQLVAFAKEVPESCVQDAVRQCTAPELGDEAAADARGLSLARAAGWSPDALAAVIARLASTETAYGGDCFHDERRAHASAARASLPPMPPPGKAGDRWRRLDELLAARKGVAPSRTR